MHPVRGVASSMFIPAATVINLPQMDIFNICLWLLPGSLYVFGTWNPLSPKCKQTHLIVYKVSEKSYLFLMTKKKREGLSVLWDKHPVVAQVLSASDKTQAPFFPAWECCLLSPLQIRTQQLMTSQERWCCNRSRAQLIQSIHKNLILGWKEERNKGGGDKLGVAFSSDYNSMYSNNRKKMSAAY